MQFRGCRLIHMKSCAPLDDVSYLPECTKSGGCRGHSKDYFFLAEAVFQQPLHPDLSAFLTCPA